MARGSSLVDREVLSKPKPKTERDQEGLSFPAPQTYPPNSHFSRPTSRLIDPMPDWPGEGGSETVGQKLIGRFWLVPTVSVVLFFSFLVYFSTRPRDRIQLSADPPPEFLLARPEWDAKRRKAEQRLAQAYWECAVRVVQWHYYYGTELPPTAPALFRIDAQAQPGAATDTAATRDYYWQLLRKAWLQPQAWKVVHERDDEWLMKRIRPLWSRVSGLLGWAQKILS